MTRVLKTQRLEIWKNRPKLSQHSTASTASWALVSVAASKAGATAARRSPKSAGGAKPYARHCPFTGDDRHRHPRQIVVASPPSPSNDCRSPAADAATAARLGQLYWEAPRLRRAPRDSPRRAHRGTVFSADVAPILALSGSAQPSNALSDMGYYIAERSYTKVKSALLRYTLLSLSWAFLSRSCLNILFFSMGNFEYASVALHYWEYTSLHNGQNRPLSCYFVL